MELDLSLYMEVFPEVTLMVMHARFFERGSTDDKTKLFEVVSRRWMGHMTLFQPVMTRFVYTYARDLTNCVPMMPYGDKDLGQHWSGWWLVA